MLSLLIACSLSLPATTNDVAVYQHCKDHQDVWVLGSKWSDLVEEHFKPEDHETAYRVIGCESNGFLLKIQHQQLRVYGSLLIKPGPGWSPC